MLTTNRATVLWSFVALAVTLAYPYAKRFVSVPQAVLGIAFSFGIPMAFAAVRGEVPPLAWWLLAGNLFWVLAYDTEYAMVDRDDDLLIGMKTSAITFGRLDVPIVMACYLLFLVVWAAIGAGTRAGPVFYLAIAAAAAQALWHWRLIRERTRDGCFKAFRLNHWLGFTVFVGVVAGYAWPESGGSGLAEFRRPARGRAGARHGAAALILPADVGALHRRDRRVGGAALGGHALAQHRRRLARAGASAVAPEKVPTRQLVGLLRRQAQLDAGFGHRLDEIEHVGRARSRRSR